MYNVHLPFTGVPFALILAAVIFEAAGIFCRWNEGSKVAHKVLLLLLILAPITYFTGYWGADDANHTFQVPLDVIETHRSYGRLFLLVFIPTVLCSSLRAAAERRIYALELIYFAFLAASLVLVVIASSHGGALVFESGAAVRAVPPAKAP